MPWLYEQASGRLTDPSGTLQGKGYSGFPPHTNCPADEALEGLGPIPCGNWEVTGLIEEHPRLGPFVLILTPDAETRARVIAMGRNPDSFRCHGERLEPPAGFASDGCLIQVRMVREMLYNSPDKWIQVVAQQEVIP